MHSCQVIREERRSFAVGFVRSDREAVDVIESRVLVARRDGPILPVDFLSIDSALVRTETRGSNGYTLCFHQRSCTRSKVMEQFLQDDCAYFGARKALRCLKSLVKG